MTLILAVAAAWLTWMGLMLLASLLPTPIPPVLNWIGIAVTIAVPMAVFLGVWKLRRRTA